MSKQTSIKEDDIIEAFRYLNAIKSIKGKHIISIPDELIDQYLKYAKKRIRLCDPKKLTWTCPNPIASSRSFKEKL